MEVAGAPVAAAVAFVITGLLEAAVVVVTAVLIAAGAVLVGVTVGVLEATVAIREVEVEATTTRGVVVATGEDEVASTCAEASWISKMLIKARAKRTIKPIPETAVMFVFILCEQSNNANNVYAASDLSDRKCGVCDSQSNLVRK